ncbi:MAG: Smr/MutS family protein [Bacteroidota bacterium]
MKVFKIGDRVEAIDDVIVGTVTDIGPNKITIESEDGFPLVYAPSELIKVSDTERINVSNYEVSQIKQEKELPKKRKHKTIKPKERNAPKMEVDLHMHQLVKHTKGMTNYDMMNIQLDTAKRQLEFAIQKRIQRVVFIHGVGEGVLKEELKYLFGRYENVKSYDADYQKYGLGATEVYIFQNV